MDTAGWPPLAVGIYWRLLMYAWINDGLPDDSEQLSRIAGSDRGNFEKSWCRFIKDKFFPDGNGKLLNRRQEEERKRQKEYYKSQSESGLRGIEIKKKKGIFPFNKSTHPLSDLSTEPSIDPSSDRASENQALQSSSSLKKEIIKKERKSVTDSEWLSSLKNKPGYKGLDIEIELSKCLTWFEAKGKIVSRQRFLNWLNRAERPIQKPDVYAHLERN